MGSYFCGKDSTASCSPILMAIILLSLCSAPLTSKMLFFFNCLTLFQAWLVGVLLLRELEKLSQCSFFFLLAKLLNCVLAFFPPDEVLLALDFLEYFVESFSFVS